jgi:hypothetical protein
MTKPAAGADADQESRAAVDTSAGATGCDENVARLHF